MANIQFDEQGYEKEEYKQPALQPEEKPFFIRLVLSTHLVSKDEQAGYVLLGFAMLMFTIALFFFAKSVVPSSTPPSDQIPFGVKVR